MPRVVTDGVPYEQRPFNLPRYDLSRKIEGPLLAGYRSRTVYSASVHYSNVHVYTTLTNCAAYA